LTAKNIFKLLLVSVASIISVVSLTVGISSIGKTEKAYNATVAMNKYEFAVDLYTPTAQGGSYDQIYAEDLYKPSSPTGVPAMVNTYDANGNLDPTINGDKAH